MRSLTLRSKNHFKISILTNVRHLTNVRAGPAGRPGQTALTHAEETPRTHIGSIDHQPRMAIPIGGMDLGQGSLRRRGRQGAAGVEWTLQSVAQAAQKPAQAPRPALEPSATLRIAEARASGIDSERGRVVGARRTRLSGPCLKSSLFRGTASFPHAQASGKRFLRLSRVPASVGHR